jgi:RNA 2',3'-cyclic 3'-phosphodiesterase
MRLFIALPVPGAVKEELAAVQSELRASLPADCVRWTRREHIHLTLGFLGDVAVARMDDLEKTVRGACAPFAPMQLRAVGVGCFPHPRHPRVIWAGVGDDGGQLRLLAQAMGQATRGFSRQLDEKDFAGHLTIGRAREIKAAEARILGRLSVTMVAKVFGEWRADTVEIMRSELSAAGSRYSCLASIVLEG